MSSSDEEGALPDDDMDEALLHTHARRERVERRPAELGFTASTEVRRALLSGSNGAQAEAAVPPPTRRKVKKPKAKAKAAEAEATDGTKAVEKEAVVEAAVPERSGSCTVEPATAAANAEAEQEEDIEVNQEMRRLLRQPRYFDQDFEQAAIRCFNCGGTGHMSHACTQPRKRRPCFLCGSLEHERNECNNGMCFRCRKPGHQARDCTASLGELAKLKKKTVHMCLRCGREGHNITACTREYRSQDLALVQCYVCLELGHLCCGNRPTVATKPSCYNCGGQGHVGPDCPLPARLCPGAAYDANASARDARPPMECFRCGGPHMKRDCDASAAEANNWAMRQHTENMRRMATAVREEAHRTAVALRGAFHGVTHNALNQGGGSGGQYQQGSPYIGGGGMNPYASPYGGIAQGMKQMGGSGVVWRSPASSSYMQQQGGGGGGLGMHMNMQMHMAMQYNSDMTTPNSTSPYGQYQVAAAASVSPYVGGDYSNHASPQAHQQQRHDSGYNSHDRRYARYERMGYDDRGREEERGSSWRNDRDGDHGQQRRHSYQDQRQQSYARYERHDDRRR